MTYSGYTDAKKAANKRYKDSNLKRVTLDFKLEQYDQIKAAAEAAGLTVSGYIKSVIIQSLEEK